MRGRVQGREGLDGAALDVGQGGQGPRDLLFFLFFFSFSDLLFLFFFLRLRFTALPQQQRRPGLRRERLGLLALDRVQLDAAGQRDSGVGQRVQQRPSQARADVDEVRFPIEARVSCERRQDFRGAGAGDGAVEALDALSAAEAGLLGLFFLEREREHRELERRG